MLLKFAVGADFFLIFGRLCARNERSAFFHLVLDRLFDFFRFLRRVFFYFRLRNRFRNRVEQFADALAVLRTDRENILDAELPKILGFAGERIGLHFIDREKQWLAAALQQARQVVVGPRQFGAHVHHHHQRVGFFERHLRLRENLCCDKFGIVGHNAAHIHHAVASAPPTRTRHRCGRA